MKTSLWFRFPIPRLSGQDPEGLFPSVVAKHLSKKMGSNLFCRGLREQKQLVFFLKSNHAKILKSDTHTICCSFCFFPEIEFYDAFLGWIKLMEVDPLDWKLELRQVFSVVIWFWFRQSATTKSTDATTSFSFSALALGSLSLGRSGKIAPNGSWIAL